MSASGLSGGRHLDCPALWLITDALYELLSGRVGLLGWLALNSGSGFVLALIAGIFPRRRIEGT